jgi:hypothetical protein
VHFADAAADEEDKLTEGSGAAAARDRARHGMSSDSEAWPSLSDVSNEAVLRGVDVAFEVSDVDTLPGDGHTANPTSAGGGGGNALTLRLSCGKGRLTFGYKLRSDGSGRSEGDGLGRGWDASTELSQGGAVGYGGGGGGRGRRAVLGLAFTAGDGVDDDYLEVVGSAAALNEALQDLRYRGQPGATGWDKIEVALSDTPLDVCGLGTSSRNASANPDGAHSSSSRMGTSAGSDGDSSSSNGADVRGNNASAAMRWFAEAWHAETALGGALGAMSFRSGPNPVEQPNWGGSGAGGSGGRKSPTTEGGGGSHTGASGGADGPGPRVLRWGGAANLCDLGAPHTARATIEVHLSPVNDPPRVHVSMPPPGAPPPPRLLPPEQWPLRLRRAAAAGGVSSSSSSSSSSGSSASAAAPLGDGGDDPGAGAWRLPLGPQRHYLPPGALAVSDPDHAQASDRLGASGAAAAFGGSAAAGHAPLTVTVRAARGRLTLGTRQEDGTALLDGGDSHTTGAAGGGGGGGDGIDQPTLRFAAFGVVAANRALAGLGYRCDAAAFPSPNPGLGGARAVPCGAGRDQVTVHVDDNGHSGRGGALTATGSLWVWVAPAAGVEDDNDPTTSHDEWAHGYRDSEGGSGRWANGDAPREASPDGSGLADGARAVPADGSSDELGNADDEGGSASGAPSTMFPSGALSWHDVHSNYGAVEEPRRTRRMGNGDFWDE